tara:strand:+ start:1410 stop:1622 length:213 start_codon:yes stop_codon:yes gene_type:complete
MESVAIIVGEPYDSRLATGYPNVGILYTWVLDFILLGIEGTSKFKAIVFEGVDELFDFVFDIHNIYSVCG